MTTPVSFEFFPPNTPAGEEKLVTTRKALAKLNPEFFSVTYGAGGATQDKTMNIVMQMHKEGLDVAPHVSCVGNTRESISQMLQTYQEAGIKRLVILRGDLPSGAGVRHNGDFRYASELVRYVRGETNDHFHIEVAAYPEMHPQADSMGQDIGAFIAKVQCGADSAITQYFFNADAYFKFCEELQARQVDIPIVPGIMPITNFKQLTRFSNMCGAEIPRWIALRLENYGDDTDSLRQFGHEVAHQLCEKLIAGGAPSLHFYTLNQSEPVIALCNALPETRS
jgi:methylenetetrahydrofolate reductase (NADPH)